MEEKANDEKVFTCQRTGKKIPLADAHCIDPKAYCKFRTSCPINMLEKKKARES